MEYYGTNVCTLSTVFRMFVWYIFSFWNSATFLERYNTKGQVQKAVIRFLTQKYSIILLTIKYKTDTAHFLFYYIPHPILFIFLVIRDIIIVCYIKKCYISIDNLLNPSILIHILNEVTYGKKISGIY